MKTIISFLLLPILAISQPINQFENEQYDMALLTEISFEKTTDASRENSVSSELFTLTTNFYQLIISKVANSNPPQFLSTYSLVGLYSDTSENKKPQERLNLLLASNDTRYPKENTLVDWLNPVRYTSSILGGVENMVQGFGPLIKI